MVRKKLAMAVLALSALQADLALALGLGNLSVKSALNQPLNAEIRLLDTGDLDPSQIKVQLAAPEDFERAGVDRNFFLTNLKFTIDMDGKGSGVIRITTHDPVNEPYLNFVVEARWPSGRLLREFAVLLDPPTFSSGAAQAAPRASAPAPQPTRKIEPPTVSQEPAAATAERLESNTLPEAAGSNEHRVQVGETLSQIAGRNRPSGASVQQTMVAIQRANPNSFINNNVNLIKAGTILRLPTAEEAQAIPAGDAGAQVAEQTHAWRSGSSTESASGPQLDASQSQPAAEGGYQEKERLTIATPGDSTKSSVGEGSGGKGTKGLEALRNQLTASQESLDSAKRDNKELQSRLDDMERQVATLQRLISLKDDQLAALQNKAADQDKTAAPAQAPAAATPAPTEAAAPTPAPAPVPAPVAPKPTPKVVPPAPQPTLVEQITGNPLYLGGILGALALAIGGAIFAKKRREQAEEDAAYQDLDLGDYTDEHEATEASVDLDNALVSDDAVVDAAHAAAPVAAEPEQKPVRSETGDAVAEADIYIAYGRYQQAVDLLTTAIDVEPDRADLRIKLLEVFLEMRNRDAFRQQFMALQSLGDGEAIAQVKDMLSSVDGVSDWLDDLPQGASSASNIAAMAAIGAAVGATAFAADKFDSEPAPEPTPEAALDDAGLDLDLDLDDELIGTEEEPMPDPEAEALLDLDLDLDSEEGSELNLDLDEEDTGELDLELGDLDIDTDNNTDASFGVGSLDEEKPYEPAPAFDPFAGSTVEAPAASGDELELDLDDEELELDLNEDDLDFALKAMEEPAGTAETNLAFEEPSFEPAAAEPAPNFGDELKDFDLSLDAFAASNEADERKAIEADLGDLEGLEGLDDLNFESSSAPSFSTPSFDGTPSFNSAPAEQPFADLDEPATAVAAQPAAPLGDDFDFLADTDEVATKLDLARAYIDMGDTDGAKDILDEVLEEGSDVQKQEASELMGRIA